MSSQSVCPPHQNIARLRYSKHSTFRSSSHLVVENIFRIFDPCRTESIRFTDLLIAFSMSMKGTGGCKLIVIILMDIVPLPYYVKETGSGQIESHLCGLVANPRHKYPISPKVKFPCQLKIATDMKLK